MVYHIRIDNEKTNDKRRFACGIGPELPEGDMYYFEGEFSARRADCQGCNPGGTRQLGTPISQLGSQPGQPGWEEFKRIASSWGYD